MRDRVAEAASLDFYADYADDGVDGGDYDAVYRVLEREIALGAEYGIKNNFSKMVLYPLAGNNFSGDLSRFTNLGIKVDYFGDLKVLLEPIVGSEAFVKEWVSQKIPIIWIICRVME